MNEHINGKILYVTDRHIWRNWLDINGRNVKEIWIQFYKKKTGKPSLPYEDSVEEALCYGWIDSIIKKIDEERYLRKYTPRSPGSVWSATNVSRIKKMIAAGKVTDHGLSLFKTAQRMGLIIEKAPKIIEPPDFMARELENHPQAMDFFNTLSPTHRNRYIAWISDAVRPDTRRRRLMKAITMLREGRKLELI